MFRNVGQPFLIRRRRAEVVPGDTVLVDEREQVVVDRHPDAGTGRGHLSDEREGYFPGRFAWDK